MSSAPGTYGLGHAVNAVTFRRKMDHGHVVRIVRRTEAHVTYRMSSGLEGTLPRSTFDEDFEAQMLATAAHQACDSEDGCPRSPAHGFRNAFLLTAPLWLLLWWLL